jgi:hypothetical protein
MQRTREHSKAFLLYIALIALLYAPVFFGAKTLLPTVVQPGGVTDGSPYGYTERVPVNTFNVDMATPAYYEFPINRTVGSIYAAGELPLWNPYQAAGTPLAADFSTRAFFPYQILEDISPVGAWDLFLLMRLLVAGLFTYLFLASAGLSFIPAFIGGVFYMFSGVFTWFMNLEQFTNVAMTLPVLMYALELLIKDKGLRNIGYSAVAFALVLLAGQPEAALYVLLLAASYIVFRSLSLFKDAGGELVSVALRSLAAFVIGLMLAAPLILPFLDYVDLSHHMHAPGKGIGLQHEANRLKVFSILTPGATEIPADPSILPEALAESRDASGGGGAGYYRVFATKGQWDYLGGFTGVLPVFLALTGLILSASGRARGVTGPLIFFSAFGSALILKNFGVRPFLWLGYLPFFDQAWSPRWSGPAWVFPAAAAGAFGLEMIVRKGTELSGGITWRALKAWYAPIASYVVIMAVFLAFAMPSVATLLANKDTLFSPRVVPYIYPAVALSHLVAFAALAAALVFTIFFLRKRIPLHAIAALAIVELWWCVPRGYDHVYMALKLLPFAAGFLGAVFFCFERLKRPAVGMFLVFFILALIVDLSSPYGLPKRHDPFIEPPYVKFLKEKSGDFRVMGGYGALAPNYAGSIGLFDLRYVNALVLPSYRDFRTEHLTPPVENEEREGSSLWFTGMPQRITVAYDERAGYHYRIVKRGVELDIANNLPYYSLMGVRYILMPSWFDPAGSGFHLPLIYDKELKIFENPDALPRAFMAFPFRDDASFATALKSARQTGKSTFLLGEPVLRDGAARGIFKEARITDYGANRVVVEAVSKKPGVLILSDVLAPGWQVRVNGEEEPVFPVNGLIRGVLLDKGKNIVEYVYSPPGFGTGVVLFLLGAVLVAAMLLPWQRLHK